MRQFRFAIRALIGLVAVGSIGYSLLWHVSLLDGLYMTVITLSTVGYRELRPPSPAVKAFTIAVIGFGVANVAWAARAAAEMAVGEQFRSYFGKRQLEQQIAKLKDHVVICGFGRMGMAIADDLARAGRPFVVIDPNPEAAERMKPFGYPFIAEDASSEAVLRAAGIERARDLVTVAPTDADNIFIVLTARGLAPHLHIVARSSRPENEDKIYRSGADKVVSPYTLGGHRMAAAILKPISLEFLDVVMGHGYSEMEMMAVEVGKESALCGVRLEDAHLPQDFGVSVIAMRREGIYGTAPDLETRLRARDVLIVIGPTMQVEAIRNL
jgi:voltage-gated potassium channel